MNRNVKRICKDIKRFEKAEHKDIFIYYDDSDIQIIYALIIGLKIRHTKEDSFTLD